MSAAKHIATISVEDYLAGEEVARHKHEYAAGRIYMMAGARNEHNALATTITILLGGQLRGRKCQPFNSDTKVRIVLASGTRFYYPDVMVVYSPNPPGDVYQDRPVVIVEVLSPATKRVDEGEKREAYMSIPTLTHYLMVDTHRPRVVVSSRTPTGAFADHVYDGMDAVIPLESIGATLALAEVYERAEFRDDSTEEEEE